jgi:hypothetical protein
MDSAGTGLLFWDRGCSAHECSSLVVGPGRRHEGGQIRGRIRLGRAALLPKKAGAGKQAEARLVRACTARRIKDLFVARGQAPLLSRRGLLQDSEPERHAHDKTSIQQ